jgi:hypothetical protein
MDSDDNDDRLSWQAVRGRGKKRTRPRKTKVPTMEKNMLQETNNHPTQITITNNSESLLHAKTEYNTKHEREDPARPPIFVSGITNMQQLTAKMEQVLNKLNYTFKIRTVTNKMEYTKQ